MFCLCFENRLDGIEGKEEVLMGIYMIVIFVMEFLMVKLDEIYLMVFLMVILMAIMVMKVLMGIYMMVKYL